MTVRRVVVIGAGTAGLAAALTLAARGLDVTVVERAERPGGKMRIVRLPHGQQQPEVERGKFALPHFASKREKRPDSPRDGNPSHEKRNLDASKQKHQLSPPGCQFAQGDDASVPGCDPAR